ncbi:Arylesterase precursor [Cystobacter fuscus DSM 2262]|uniref:Arylesterase n=1 Tax=Cystobacter fuscus (strain ATCC 25194 / DSM 2262 / NBRC 100088 / M29) TaxID=1242864 RepID=S9QD74_CYSF2|nr:arylesterase [Cystobacter fuscus]EPX59294.1 Arylesterase precursor [Cystobacter fuscus DSM 2262]
MRQGYMRERTRTVGVLGYLVMTLAMGLATLGAPVAEAGPARTVLVMGDSLSAAYGLAPEEGWVALTAEQMARQTPGWRVVNASVSGETTAGGAARIEGELARNQPAVVVIALGGNDGLRGLSLKQTRANLEKLVSAAKASGARVLLVGMRMPPNLGKAYTEGFAANYRAVAEAHKVSLLPFLLEPIAMERASFQSDNIHPVAAVQPKLRDHVWPALAPLLK